MSGASDSSGAAARDDDGALPKTMPGREPDDALGLDALRGVRQVIVDNVEATQGAWQRLPAWRRFAPLAAAALAGAAWVAYGLAQGDAAPSALIAILAAAVALGSLAIAPRAPGRAERLALLALVVGAAAVAVECIAKARLAPAVPANDAVCAGAICIGAVLPVLFVALHLRLSRSPARLLHVVAVAVAGVVASMAAVWAECPGTELGHIVRSHVLAPALAAVLLIVALRPALRGPRVTQKTTPPTR